MKQMILSLLIIGLLKGLVYFGVLSTNDINNPLKISIDIKGLNINFNKEIEDQLDLQIINNSAKIGNDLFSTYDLVDINGKTYVVDIGLTKVKLIEYTIIERVKRNFHLLNSETKFAWTIYLRILIIIIFVLIFYLPDYGIGYSLFLIIIQSIFLLLPTFFILNYLGWNGWLGYILFLIFLVVDIYLGYVQADIE